MSVKLRKFYETGNQVNDDPIVCVFEDFIREPEIEALLAAAKPQLKQALVSAADSGVPSPRRTGSNCWVPHGYNSVVEELSLRIAEVVGIGLEFAESLQVIHYNENEEYAPHYDGWDKNTERGQRCMAKGGQRMVTCILYLNDVAEGGGTSFPKLDMEIRAKKGRMVLFHNCQEGSAMRHPESLHSGLPVVKGEKWACNFWFRELQYQTTTPIASNPSEPSSTTKFNRVI